MNRRLVPLLSVLVALVAIGLCGWITWERQRSTVRSATITRHAGELGPDAQLLLPNLKDQWVWVPDRPHDPQELLEPDRDQRFQRRRSFQVSTNSEGLRGPEIQLPAPGFRILCVGDSVTFGWGLPVGQAYPTLLEDELDVEVINAGMPAAAPPEIATWARQHAARLDADLVLFVKQPQSPGGGDAVTPYLRELRALADALNPVPIGVVLPPRSTFSARPDAVAEQESQHVIEGLAPLPVLDLTPIFREAQQAPGVLGEREGDIQRVLLLPDRRVLLEAPAPPKGLAPALAKFFEDNPHAVEPLIYDGGHPDRDGHRLMARSIARWVRDHGWLP